MWCRSFGAVDKAPTDKANISLHCATVFFGERIFLAFSHGPPQAWARGGTCLLWKWFKVFLCISSYSKMLSRRIIYVLFSQPVIVFWRLCPQSPSGPHRHPSRWETFVPRSLICPPLKKIQRSPMPSAVINASLTLSLPSYHCRLQSVYRTVTSLVPLYKTWLKPS